ncbi:ankyrin repeat protein [Reticulomyxa filosa]|uniref:Ankyrin repeat protein n=1 Tax=Reticulomyxa filosa TaxID=46433 RepID=X6NKJ4_RETFI|nr:ankyrin repeat protein [Reticulomyxa filosa]|eukprot:ETO26506.1 ankyrin repeat protein [Reticulomyxa filosa]
MGQSCPCGPQTDPQHKPNRPPKNTAKLLNGQNGEEEISSEEHTHESDWEDEGETNIPLDGRSMHFAAPIEDMTNREAVYKSWRGALIDGNTALLEWYTQEHPELNLINYEFPDGCSSLSKAIQCKEPMLSYPITTLSSSDFTVVIVFVLFAYLLFLFFFFRILPFFFLVMYLQSCQRTRGGTVQKANHLNPKTGNTPLHESVLVDNPKLVTFLVKEKQVDTTIKNNEGKTPYDLALQLDNSDLIELLEPEPLATATEPTKPSFN